MRAGFAAAFHNPAFRVLWCSEAISLIGDRILMIALINLVYERNGSAAAVGLLTMIKALPALLVGTLAGVLVDRWSRKWTMVFSNLALFGLVLAIPQVRELWLIFVLYGGMSVISQFFIPARSATIPNLVPTESLVAANALFAAAFVGAMAIGPAVGGWISDRYGLNTAFYVDAATFLVPAVAVSLLVIPSARRSPTHQSLVTDWREGFALLKSEARFRTALLLLAVASVQIASLSTLGVMVVRERLAGSAGDYGWVMSIAGMGMLAGVLLSTQLGKRLNRQHLASSGTILAGVAMIGMAFLPLLGLVMACAFLLGMGMITVQVQTQTTLQLAPDTLRGRMMGLSQTVMGSMTFLIAGLAGLLAGQFGAAPILFAAGLFAAVAGLIVLVFSPRASGVSDQVSSS
jgi:MFS family permease